MEIFQESSVIGEQITENVNKINLCKFPTTRTAYYRLKEYYGIDIWDHFYLRLRLINMAVNFRRRLSEKDLDNSYSEIQKIIEGEEKQKKLVNSIGEGWVKDRVIKIEALHDEKNIYMWAITQNGYRITIRTISHEVVPDKSVEKIQMAQNFLKQLIGREINFMKRDYDLPKVEGNRVVGSRGKRTRLLVRLSELPEFKNLEYKKLKQWNKENKI